jgi:putative nucleotidyltransferase with HDIG domain
MSLPPVDTQALRLRTYIGAQSALAIFAIGVAIVHTGVPNWTVTIVLAAVTAIAERLAPRVSATVVVSVSFLPVALAAVLFGPAAAGIVAACGMLGYVVEWPLNRFAFFTSARALGGAAAGLCAQLVIPAGSNVVSLPRLLVAAAAASAAWTVVDFATNSVVGSLRGVISPRALWRNMRGTVMVAVALYIPVTALFAYAYLGAGEWVLAFFAIPTAAAHLTLRALANLTTSRDELAEANRKLEQSNLQLRRVNLSFTRAMVRALDARDNWTANHSTAVAAYSRDICERMGLPPEVCERVHLVGMVHDVGKIAVPSEILQKTSALTDDEWALMREHSAEGEQILREVEGYADIAAIVRSHHERWDGAGYPDRIAGEDIPELARVIAVADSYNAMTTARPYRGPMTPEQAIEQLVRGKGTQFEVGPVDAFIAVLADADEGYRLGAVFKDFEAAARVHVELVPTVEVDEHDIAA